MAVGASRTRGWAEAATEKSVSIDTIVSYPMHHGKEQKGRSVNLDAKYMYID
jgi:hypothetical protein